MSEDRAPFALRKWSCVGDEVTIMLTHRPDDAQMKRLNLAIRAFIDRLSSTEDTVDRPLRYVETMVIDRMTPEQHRECGCAACLRWLANAPA